MRAFSTNKPTVVFNPCGHSIDEEGAKVWASIAQPSLFDPIHVVPSTRACPFCRATLSSSKPFSKLIYQTEVDED